MSALKQTTELVRHESPIFSIALSRDERLLACGGTETSPVTIWNLADGTCVARPNGMKRQTHALAFSKDGSRLAAANLWGMQRVWSLPDGALIEGEGKEGESGRQTRSLVYPDSTTGEKQDLVMISGSLSGGKPDRVLAPNGVAVADVYRGVRVLKYRTTKVLAELDAERSPLMKSGVRSRSWSSDSKVLALAGDGWAGAWLPFETGQPLFIDGLSSPEQVNVIAAMNDPTRLLYVNDQRVLLMELPTNPLLAPKRTAFEEFVSRLPEPESPSFQPRNLWKWGFTQWGHEGAHTMSGEIVWYSMSSGRDDGGSVQSFESFLRDGPSDGRPPETTLIEMCQAVRILARLAAHPSVLKEN